MSSSPDETALVQAAEKLGFIFMERSPDMIVIKQVMSLLKQILMLVAQ